ncbi:hypothetical protein DQM20_09240 [Lactiplantibacillus plantarum]|nr:hypothetical protein DQM20_09240 [Lactiplantibacillus plantarum]
MTITVKNVMSAIVHFLRIVIFSFSLSYLIISTKPNSL